MFKNAHRLFSTRKRKKNMSYEQCAALRRYRSLINVAPKCEPILKSFRIFVNESIPQICEPNNCFDVRWWTLTIHGQACGILSKPPMIRSDKLCVESLNQHPHCLGDLIKINICVSSLTKFIDDLPLTRMSKIEEEEGKKKNLIFWRRLHN